ncbi:MAG: PilN domain-containing protein [Burkholderiales bacterium]
MPGALQIDFAGAPRGANRGGAILLLAGLAVAAGIVGGYLHLRQETDVVQARIEALSRNIRANGAEILERDPRKLRALRARIEASNRILSALDQPWIRLFDELESATVDGVTLLAMEPDGSKALVRLVGEARDRATLSRYLERLGRLASLREVRLNQHEIRDARGGSSLRFVVSARWVRPA